MTETQGSVVIERTFDAPVDLVWAMWTDPGHFAAWYGPQGASVPVATMDVRVGGRRLVCMEVGDMRMWFAGEYREVVASKRLVYTEFMADENGNAVPPPPGHPEMTEVIVELEDEGGRTRMTMTHAGIPAESPGAAGWHMAFDKLDAHLATRAG